MDWFVMVLALLGFAKKFAHYSGIGPQSAGEGVRSAVIEPG
jgi:hypothetical protein